MVIILKKRDTNMFIRKSKISSLIKKERTKERQACEKEYNSKITRMKGQIISGFKNKLKIQKNEYETLLAEKNKEIAYLKKEIEKNFDKYKELRLREKNIELLATEFEDVVENMLVKISESTQPFYRTRSKIEITKRKSDKMDRKIETVFRSIQ